jgi:Ricin-type beta-trefoil lectin domain
MRRVGLAAIAFASLVGVGDAQQAHGASAPPTEVHGTNFLLKSQIDTNFCIEVENGTGEGRTITLQTCGGADTQRWALPLNSDDTNLIVDSQGLCLDGRFTKGDEGLPRSVAKCGPGKTWRFVINSAGQVMTARRNLCLSVPGAASNASVSLEPCDVTHPGQLWTLAH